MMTAILTFRPAAAPLRLAAMVIAAGPAFPVLAESAPRGGLPSSEAISWLLETEATGAAVPWENSQRGYSGTVTITHTWYRADGTPCREYTVAAVAGGPRTMVKGTGCRVEAGLWNLSEDTPTALAAMSPTPPTKKPEVPGDAPALTPPASPPATAAAPLPAEPAVEPLPDSLPADDIVVSTPARFIPAPAEHEVLVIPASVPSRSEE